MEVNRRVYRQRRRSMKSAIIAVGPAWRRRGKSDSYSSGRSAKRDASHGGQLTPGMMTMRPDIASGKARR
jgi:hypothetical protein